VSLRANLTGERAIRSGIIASAVWLLLVGLVALLGPEGAAPASGWTRIGALAGIVLPLALIWTVVGMMRALAELKAEAEDLRAALVDMAAAARTPAIEAGPRAAGASLPASQPATQEARRPLPAARPARAAGLAAAAARRMAATARPASPSDSQSSLDLDAPAPVTVDRDDLIRALNFPDSPDDGAAVAALHAALRDPEAARLIRAAQDVIMLLAERGLYMDDRPPVPDRPGLWRRLAEGERGVALADLLAPSEPAAAEGVAAALRGDEVFRDTAHHFLRRWDKMLAQQVPGLDDARVMALADTRSGRAFALLAEASGSFA